MTNIKISNMESTRGNLVPNQFIINDYESRKTIFQSYDSTIIVIDRLNKVIEVHPDWDYSRTTGKYRNLFFDVEGFYELASKKGLLEAIEKGEYRVYKVVLV